MCRSGHTLLSLQNKTHNHITRLIVRLKKKRKTKLQWGVLNMKSLFDDVWISDLRLEA